MSERYHGFDLARAIFMTIGVFYHCSNVYTLNGHWLESSDGSDTGSYAFNILSNFLHLFRMPAFFMLAGFFLVMVVKKYGIKKAFTDKLRRLGVPLLVVGFTLNILMNQITPAKEFTIGLHYFTEGQWLYHLWFIGNLLVYSVVGLFFCHYFAEDKSNKIPLSLILLATFIIVPITSLILPRVGGIIYSSDILFISPMRLYQYTPYFILGMFFYSIRTRLMELLNIKISLLLFSYYVLLTTTVNYFSLFDFSWTVQTFVLLTGYTALILSILGGFNCYKGGSKLITKMVDSSYSVYLLHMPVLTCSFYVVSYLGLNIWISYILLTMMVYTISYQMHDKIIRTNHVVSFLFNGVPLKAKNQLSFSPPVQRSRVTVLKHSSYKENGLS